MSVRQLLTPKQVARAIGVSESSLKRWCDRGVLPTVRTAGGHRRLPVSGVLRYLRETGHQAVDPEVLGLPSAVGQGTRVISRAARELFDSLVAGNEDVARRVLYDLYLSGISISQICDEVICPAFKSIGESWSCGDVQIYSERQACEISLRIIHELRLSWNGAAGDLPLAIGGTLSGDNYVIPTAMVELVLLERGWRAVSLGTNLPAKTLSAAIANLKPALFWLSVSHVEESDSLLADIGQLVDQANQSGANFVFGGRGLTESVIGRVPGGHHCPSLKELENLTQKFHAPSSLPLEEVDAVKA